MSDQHSTETAGACKPTKPSKPYDNFPLFAHAAGVWAKKIRGKMHYFGPWSDPNGALKKYLAEKDSLEAGRNPRQNPDAHTVKDVAYLAFQLSIKEEDGHPEAGFGQAHRDYRWRINELVPIPRAAWRHLRAVLLLPFVVIVVVPSLLLFLTGTDTLGLGRSVRRLTPSPRSSAEFGRRARGPRTDSPAAGRPTKPYGLPRRKEKRPAAGGAVGPRG
jgi:hypothetical protein